MSMILPKLEILAKRAAAIVCLFLAFQTCMATQTKSAVDGGWKNYWQQRLERRLFKVVGSTAKNCGRAEPYTDPSAATNCAMDAYHGQKPFYVIYEMRGIDSLTGRGLANDSGGHLYSFSFDSSGDRFTIKECNPSDIVQNRTGRLNCPSARAIPWLDDKWDQGFCLAVPISTPLPDTNGLSGTLDLRIIVDKDGKIRDATVTKENMAADATQKVMEAVKTWTFEPAIRDGTEVATIVPITTKFQGGQKLLQFPRLEGKVSCLWTKKQTGSLSGASH